MAMEPTAAPAPPAGHEQTRRGLAAGLYGTATVTLVGAVVHTVVTAFPFPPSTAVQTVIGAPSGDFDSFFIERIGHWAGYLSLAAAAVLFVASGLLIGWLACRAGMRRVAWIGLFGLLWLAVLALYSAPPPAVGRAAFAAGSAPIFLLGAWVAMRAAARRPAPATHPRWARTVDTGRDPVPGPETPQGTSRRYFLKASGVGIAGAALGLANVGGLFGGEPDPGARPLRAGGLQAAPVPKRAPGDAAFDSIAGLSPEVTPASAFYVVDKDLINPVLAASTWRLFVHGEVAAPRRFTHGQLLARRLRQRYQTLECISNQVGGNLISTGRFAGLPLSELIAEARPARGVRTVIFRSAGGYTESLPLEAALDPNTWVVVGLNGHLLPRAHGFPARILSTGTYGMKNPKWLTEVELSRRPTYNGYWELRGWAAGAKVQTMSRFDVPADGATAASPVTFAGVAFAADRGISRVEVSTDGGGSWAQARLKSALSPLTWRLWRYDWTPPRAGTYKCMVRAYDGAGVRQGNGAFDPFPRGTAGYHTISVTVG